MRKSPLTLIRRNGLYYGTLVEVSKERMSQEPEKVLKFAEENQCVLIQSSMLEDFPPELLQWVEENFVSDEGRYLRRGFETEEAAGYKYICRVPGWYKLHIDPAAPVRVNGVCHQPGLVLLNQGLVSFESDFPLTTLRCSWERGDCPSHNNPVIESSASSSCSTTPGPTLSGSLSLFSL